MEDKRLTAWTAELFDVSRKYYIVCRYKWFSVKNFLWKNETDTPYNIIRIEDQKINSLAKGDIERFYMDGSDISSWIMKTIDYRSHEVPVENLNLLPSGFLWVGEIFQYRPISEVSLYCYVNPQEEMLYFSEDFHNTESMMAKINELTRIDLTK